MRVRPIVGLGAGGHAKVMIDILRCDPEAELVGLLDADPRLKGQSVGGVPVLGADDLLPELRARGVRHAFIGLGCTGDARPRARLYELALAAGFEPVAARHPAAIVSPSVRLGPGISLMAGAILNADALVGRNVIVNTGAIVEHDCVVGDHAHVAPGARLASSVHVGDGAHIGLGAIVRQRIRIGRYAQVGAGAVVVKDVEDGVVVTGVPARLLRRVEA